MTEILYVRKQEDKFLEVNDVIKGFEHADNLDDIKNYVEKAKDRMYISWASVDARDKAGERIPIDDSIAPIKNLKNGSHDPKGRSTMGKDHRGHGGYKNTFFLPLCAL